MRPRLSGPQAFLPVAALLVAACVCACATPEDDPESDATWVGTITTEGNVTTVVNESGSVWGGTATLVEEASIGMAEGPEEQLFGFLAGVGLAMDRIFVLDAQLRVIRSYDASGKHLADCGGPGQGPGELDPSSLLVELATSAWTARRFRAYLHSERFVDPPSWSASELAEFKPSFSRFLPDRSDRVWVLRPGPGKQIAGCNEQASEYSEFAESPCWEDTTLVDVFAADGRYLGRVEVPAQMRWSPAPYILDTSVVSTAQDDAGTIMVKRYRLVLPGEE